MSWFSSKSKSSKPGVGFGLSDVSAVADIASSVLAVTGNSKASSILSTASSVAGLAKGGTKSVKAGLPSIISGAGRIIAGASGAGAGRSALPSIGGGVVGGIIGDTIGDLFEGGAVAPGAVCPAGYHPAKDGSGRCVKNRRMNPLNPRAFRRALRRMKGAKKFAAEVERAFPKRRRRSRTVPHHHHGGHHHHE